MGKGLLQCCVWVGLETLEFRLITQNWFKRLQCYEFERISGFKEQFCAFFYDYRKERYLKLCTYNQWRGGWTDSPGKGKAVFVHQTGAAMPACVGPVSQSKGTVTLPLLGGWGELWGQKAVEGMGTEIWRLFLSFPLTYSAHFYLKITLKSTYLKL